MGEFQDKLYSEGKEGLVIIFQAMDAAGKDSTIKHVMKGLNPQGIDVYSFKQPSVEEDAHGFLWRCANKFPARGKWRFSTDPIMRKFLLCVCINYMKTRKSPDRCKKGNVFERKLRILRILKNISTTTVIVLLNFFSMFPKKNKR